VDSGDDQNSSLREDPVFPLLLRRAGVCSFKRKKYLISLSASKECLEHLVLFKSSKEFLIFTPASRKSLAYLSAPSTHNNRLQKFV
jgi:hypothetical protein